MTEPSVMTSSVPLRLEPRLSSWRTFTPLVMTVVSPISSGSMTSSH